MNEWTMVGAFDGVGGFPLAFGRAGVKLVATIEKDKQASGVLKEHWPDVTHLKDITEVTADDILATGFVPRRGIVTAGFPCQDLSVAGRRAGMVEGTRSGLYWHLDRLVAELRPAWVVYENVPGLLSSTCPCRGDGSCEMDNGRPFRCPRAGLHTVPGGACVGGCIATHGGTMGAVLGSMGHRGYGFAYRVLDAQYFGVPQRRRRVFIVGRLGDNGRAPAEVLFDADSSVGNLAARPETWTRPTSRPRGRARGIGVNPGSEHIAGSLVSNTQGGVRTTDIAGAYVVEGIDIRPESGQASDLAVKETDVSSALTARQLADQGDRGTRVVTYRKAGRAQTSEDDETWTEDDKANTVNTFDGGDARATELVVTPINADALRGEGIAKTPSADAENNIRLRDPGFGVGEPGDPAGTLAAAGPGAVAVMGDQTHSLTAEGHDASEDGSGRGTPIVAQTAATLSAGSHAPNVNAPGRRKEDDENLVAYPLTARDGKGTPSDATNMVEVSPSVTAKWAKGSGGPAGDEVQNLTPSGATVRRLTPVECERLQGYEDNWTKTSSGKAQADSPRYKQMGNSLAVPVVEWIAHRLVAVERHMS